MSTLVPKCQHCHDTGNLHRDPHGQLDCAHCDVADRRVELLAWATHEGIWRWDGGVSSWELWRIYQRGLAAPRP